MTRRFILYVAISADGFLARHDDDVAWLDAFTGDYGMREFYGSIDTVILGRKTWEVGRRLGMEAYEGVTNYVLSRTKPDSDKVLHATDAVTLVRELRAKEGKDVWLCGGAEIFGTLLDANEIDEIALHVIPVVIGEGIPLFSPKRREVRLELIASDAFNDGVVRLRYRVTKAP